ncbi:DUF952 domain-containing protein [Litoreibacter ponti]|nr:DUF952 domain-containing protein [Litoreibacter ponti]
MLIYKIMHGDALAEFRESGRFTGAAIDLADGYIHFSTAAQARETAAKHFAGQGDLALVWGEEPADAALKWEVSRGGDKFPHLYRDWMWDEVEGEAPLPWNGTAHEFPSGVK